MLDVHVWSGKRSRQRFEPTTKTSWDRSSPSSRHQARSHGYLFAVADGVGGLDLGEVASSTAISVLTKEFEKAQPVAQCSSACCRDSSSTPMPPSTIAPWLPNFAERRWQPPWSPARCATTRQSSLTLAIRAVTWFAKAVAKQITQDHTWVNEQTQDGPDLGQRYCRNPNRATC